MQTFKTEDPDIIAKTLKTYEDVVEKDKDLKQLVEDKMRGLLKDFYDPISIRMESDSFEATEVSEYLNSKAPKLF